MTTWILARQLKGQLVYWLGTVDDRGLPRWTIWRADSKHFTTPRCAYEAAETHPRMNLDEWRAIPAAPLLKEPKT